MSLTQALVHRRSSGLRTTQAGLVARRRQRGECGDAGLCAQDRWCRSTTAAGGIGVSVRVAAINRELDQYVQRQLRVETLRRELRQPARAVLSSGCRASTACRARRARSRRCSTISPTALQALSTSPDSLARAQRRAQRRAGAGPAAQRHDHRHPGAAQRRRARPRGRGRARQQRDAADRRRSIGSSRTADRQRCRDRDPARPARRLYRRARAA